MPALSDRLLAWLGLDFGGISLRNEALSAIAPSLFVGVRPRPDDVPALREAGITHVFSCLDAGALPKVAFLEGSFRVERFSLRDAMDADLTGALPAFFAFAEEASGGTLLVHCEAGVSRSATLATALLMRRERLSFLEAYRRLRTKRPGVLPNIGFASQLQHFEATLRPGARGTPSSLATYLREYCAAPVELAVLDEMLLRHDDDAPRALQAIFGGEIPRVVQGARR
ncbi:MAG: dual specificity protein phosphatase [Myxococcota bacterium]